MGQITKATFDMIDHHLEVGKTPPLTINEYGQIFRLAYQAFVKTSEQELKPSNTLETQYGPHDPTRIGGWFCVRWDKDYPAMTDSYSGMRILDSEPLSIGDIHEHQMVFNVVDNRFVKNRTLLSHTDAVRMMQSQLEILVDRRFGKSFDVMYQALCNNNKDLT